MGLWLLQLPVLAMGAIILGLIYLGTAIIYWSVMSLARDDRKLRAFKAISPGMLPPISSSSRSWWASWPPRSGATRTRLRPRWTARRSARRDALTHLDRVPRFRASSER